MTTEESSMDEVNNVDNVDKVLSDIKSEIARGVIKYSNVGYIDDAVYDTIPVSACYKFIMNYKPNWIMAEVNRALERINYVKWALESHDKTDEEKSELIKSAFREIICLILESKLISVDKDKFWRCKTGVTSKIKLASKPQKVKKSELPDFISRLEKKPKK